MREPTLQLKRHVVPLTPQETDEVVSIIADLIVGFLQVRKDDRLPLGGCDAGAKQAEPATANPGEMKQ